MFFNKNEITVKIDKKLFDEVSKLEGNPAAFSALVCQLDK